MITKIYNASIIVGSKIIRDNLYLENEKIRELTAADLPCDRSINGENFYLSPGFIDIHVHGGGGSDFCDGTAEDVQKAVHCHLRHGTTTIFPTLTSTNYPQMERCLAVLTDAAKRLPEIAGVHLEGPYFSPAQSGAQDPARLQSPRESDYRELLQKYPIIKRWTYAPERDTDFRFLQCLRDFSCVPSAGHTDATCTQMEQAFARGCRLITHLYSCTSTIRREKGFRIAGVTEAAYLLDALDVELIADGKHLPPELLRLAYRSKGSAHIALVTDAMRAAGTHMQTAKLGSRETGLDVIVEDGVAKLPDRSAFAGSVATADVLLRTALHAGIPLAEGVKMLTETPSRIMGLKRRGKIRRGYDADLVLFDPSVAVKKVIRSGREVCPDNL